MKLKSGIALHGEPPDTGPSGTLVRLETNEGKRIKRVWFGDSPAAVRGFSAPYLVTVPYDLEVCPSPYPVTVEFEGGGTPMRGAFLVTSRGSRPKPELEPVAEVGFYQTGQVVDRGMLELVVYGTGFDTESTIRVDGREIETFAAGFSMKNDNDRILEELEAYCGDRFCQRQVAASKPLLNCYERALVGLVPLSQLRATPSDHHVIVVNKGDGGKVVESSQISFKVPVQALTVRLDTLHGLFHGTWHDTHQPPGLVCHEGDFATWRRAFSPSGLALDIVSGPPVKLPGPEVDWDGREPGILEGTLYDLFQDDPKQPVANGDWYVRGLVLTGMIKEGTALKDLYGVRVNQPLSHGIAVFAALLPDPDKLLRTSMHELGHALGLAHCQGDTAGTTLMNQSGCLATFWDFSFSDSGLTALTRAALSRQQPMSTLQTFDPNKQDACCFDKHGSGRSGNFVVEGGGPALPSTTAASAAPDRPTQVEFELSGPRKIRRGTPLMLKATLRNTGDSPVDAIPLLDPAHGFVSYIIGDPVAGAKTYVPYFSYEASGEQRSLRKDAPIKAYVPVFCAVDGYSFLQARPEPYSIIGVYRGLRGDLTGQVVESKPFIFELTDDPAQRGDEVLMASEEVCRYIAVGGARTLSHALEQLKKVAEHGGDLAPYANEAIGLTYLRRIGAPPPDRLNPADKALPYLERAYEREEGMLAYHRILLHTALIESSLRKSRPDYAKAESYFNALQSRFQGEILADPFIQRTHRLLLDYVQNLSVPIDLKPFTLRSGANCAFDRLQYAPTLANISGMREKVAEVSTVQVRGAEFAHIQGKLAGDKAVIIAPLELVDGVNVSPESVEITVQVSTYNLRASINIDEIGLPAEFLRTFRPNAPDLRVDVPITIPCFARHLEPGDLSFKVVGDPWSGVSPNGQRAKIKLALAYPDGWEGLKSDIHFEVSFARIR
ncbi:MAG TPA: hypothetical protein VHQ90_26430 [Thermoanaerobaculia bacterium]|nr:hypothetical protein [Thermoanaerobaculia bacterium]